jgi:hypothetical protein
LWRAETGMSQAAAATLSSCDFRTADKEFTPVVEATVVVALVEVKDAVRGRRIGVPFPAA